MIVRFADDFVCAFQDKQDAESYYRQLDERLRKFALEISPEKTNILQFSRFRRQQSKTFEFLGLDLFAQ